MRIIRQNTLSDPMDMRVGQAQGNINITEHREDSPIVKLTKMNNPEEKKSPKSPRDNEDRDSFYDDICESDQEESKKPTQSTKVRPFNADKRVAETEQDKLVVKQIDTLAAEKGKHYKVFKKSPLLLKLFKECQMLHENKEMLKMPPG